MRNRAFVVAVCAVLLATGCSKEQAGPGASPAPAPSLTNSTGFPLYADALIIDVRQFKQVVDPSQQSGSSVASLGKGTYAGREVLASSSASQDDLIKWLQQVATAPPEGYKPNPSISKMMAGNETLASLTHRYGIDFVAFQNGSNKGATVVVMDPKTVTAKLGPVLTVIRQYNAMPLPVRQSMDNQVKQRTGVSISEAMDRSAPLGAALAAVNAFKDSDKRAIIIITAEKQM